jgi:PAS domain S-box-containing protein
MNDFTPHTRLKVLVVDDTAINRLVMSKQLSGLGYECIEATDGEHGLAQLQAHQPDVLLLDLMMPGMDGYMVTEAIRQQETASRLPIIVISALEDEASVVKALEAGADDYLPRPVKRAVLGAKLNNFAQALRARKQTQEILDRHHAITDNIQEGLVTIDGQGHIEWVNASVSRMFVCPAEQLRGLVAADLVVQAEREPFTHALAERRDLGEGCVLQSHGQRWDGTAFPMEVSLSAMSLNGEHGHVAVLRDTTEREKLERMKQDFISVVNHELRTPLTSIVGSLALLGSGKVGELPDKALKMVKMAERNTQRLHRLINDILDLDKIEAGSMKFFFQRVSAAQQIREAVTASEGFAAAKGMKLVVLEPLHDGTLRVDPDRFQQIMANLLSNALKFSGGGTTIEIRSFAHAHGIRVGVRDHGQGIPDEFKSRIFKRFAQSESPDNRTREGSGLGLSIVKAIVQQMGGDIGFDTWPGEGTEFHFSFPVVNDAGQENAS